MFGAVPGVVRTRVGYCGGHELNPDYHDLKDHSETTQIQFDPSKITYKQLLKIFWDRHDYANPIEKQYKSATQLSLGICCFAERHFSPFAILGSRVREHVENLLRF